MKVEIVDAREIRFNHRDISVILKSAGAKELLDETTVAEDHVGVYFQNGCYVETLMLDVMCSGKGSNESRSSK